MGSGTITTATTATTAKKSGAKRPRVASPTHVTATMNNANRTPITCGHLTALHYSRGNCKVCTNVCT
jgi:2-keto-3-deoxy-6-phosphogluconate aldolase